MRLRLFELGYLTEVPSAGWARLLPALPASEKGGSCEIGYTHSGVLENATSKAWNKTDRIQFSLVVFL